MPARGMFGWTPPGGGRLHQRRSGHPEGRRETARSHDRIQGRCPPAGFGHVCTMFGPAKRTVGDLEGKSSSEPLRTPVAARCKRMPTDDLGEFPQSA
jgi:hypothetical protein